MDKNKWKSLLISLTISLGTGVVSAILTMGGMRDYADLYKPPLSPPGWLFPVVWTILYILMGVAAWLVLETGRAGVSGTPQEKEQKAEAVRLGLTLYGIQLLLNGAWSLLFFNQKMYFLAFADLLLLWLAIYLTIQQFKQVNRIAALLLVPYLVWVTFAGYLNLAIAVQAL